MGYNAQARKWLMVINNPAEAGLGHAAITEDITILCKAVAGSTFLMFRQMCNHCNFSTHLYRPLFHFMLAFCCLQNDYMKI